MDGGAYGRGGPLMFAAVSMVGAAGEIASTAETTVLNVPASMLFMAIAGTMIGFILLPSRDAARVTHYGKDWRARLIYRIATAIPLILFVLCYAFIAAWVVQFGVAVIHTISRLTIEESLILPATAIVGVGIRPWLPALLVAVERRAQKVIGGGE